MPGKNFLLMGHRGAPALEPENTLPSFLKALECGATGVEFDVRLSRDGIPVISHDEDLRRVANAELKVSEATYPELLRVSIQGKARIPTLREVLALAKGRLSVDIELKVVGAEREVVDALRELDMVDDAIVTSFIPEALRRVRELDQSVGVGVLLEEWDDEYLEIASSLKAEAILPYYEVLDRELVSKIKTRGYKIITWTVDDPKIAEKLYDMGVEGIGTNNPCNLKPVAFKRRL
jgi:glycerophosphoryl diester phosphodiesterase